VAAQDDAALEAEQEVLPDRLDRLEPPPVEALRDAGEPAARMRRRDLEPLADEYLEPPRRPVERVAFGHAASVAPSL
jgi:hypothetical protein